MFTLSRCATLVVHAELRVLPCGWSPKFFIMLFIIVYFEEYVLYYEDVFKVCTW